MKAAIVLVSGCAAALLLTSGFSLAWTVLALFAYTAVMAIVLGRPLGKRLMPVPVILASATIILWAPRLAGLL